MSDTVAAGQLRAFVERIERLQEERKTIADDIAEVFKELEGSGFDKIAAKAILKIRAADDGLAIWQERSAILDLYLGALGMLPETLPAPARARPREIIEHFPPHDAETGEITEHHSSAPPPPETTDTTEALTPRALVANSPETANEMDRADEGSFETGIVAAGNRLEANPAGPVAGEVSHAGAGEIPATVPEPFEPPAFLKKDRAPLRPHCLHPDNLELCAGSGSKHCHSCLKVRDEALVAA